jgi:poly-gamma-glutamate capsule biosynthesis protein CapA/YwtB (metallophosphatase superfamily)
MNAQPPSSNRALFGRPVLTVTLILAVLLGVGVGSVAFANRGSDRDAPRWQPAPGGASRTSAAPRAKQTESDTTAETSAFTLSATGDIIMGSAPNRLPARGGEGFFDSVRDGLASDLVMGNLEQPLTGDTGSSKCGSPPRANCFAFRSPTSYAAHLKDAGFQLLNTANNHSKDYGAQGYRNTVEALEGAGLAHTGAEDQITVVETKGVKVAVLGFSPYEGANDLNDLDHARSVVQKATEQADVVVVQVHMGAEGSDRTHVRPGSELFFGENRGNPIRFSKAVIDAGADLVIGHGPHVLRGMQFYQGKLIAYSLGNFAGGGKTLSNTGVLKYGGILRVSLTKDGSWAGGTFVSTYMNQAGVPTRDTGGERSRKLVAALSKDDFGDAAAKIGSDGSISPPA